jgi:hypothetical protein
MPAAAELATDMADAIFTHPLLAEKQNGGMSLIDDWLAIASTPLFAMWGNPLSRRSKSRNR